MERRGITAGCQCQGQGRLEPRIGRSWSGWGCLCVAIRSDYVLTEEQSLGGQ